MSPTMDIPALNDFIDNVFPQLAGDYRVEELAADRLVVRLRVSDRHLRPGETISGPSMFALADVAVYLALQSRIGPITQSVTTSCSIDFMRRPAAGTDLLATAYLLKLGRVLAVGDVHIRSEGAPDIVARATVTYSIPPAA